MGIAEILKAQENEPATSRVVHQAGLNRVEIEEQVDYEDSPTDHSVEILEETSEHSEQEPLLEKDEEHVISRESCLLRLWKSEKLRYMVKAVLAFSLSMCFTFIEPLNDIVGDFSYLSAVTILFFHPCKSVGAMLEAVFFGVIGTMMGAFTSLLGLYLTTRMSDSGEGFQDMVGVIALIFCSTFVLAYVRARSSRPPVYTGIIIAQMLIAITLLGNVADNIPQVNLKRLTSIISGICFGVSISLISNLLFWPKSATAELQQSLVGTLKSLASLSEMLVQGFLLEEMQSVHPIVLDSPVNRRKKIVEKAVEDHRKKFAQLTRTNTEAKMELFPGILLQKTRTYQPIISSINRLSQHIGGMKSSIIKEDDMLSSNRLSQVNSALLMEFIGCIKAPVKKLTAVCVEALREAGRFSSIRVPWFRDIEKERHLVGQIGELQERVRNALKDFDQAQRQKMMILYENERFDGTPNDELFLVYFFVFCMMEFAKEIDKGLLECLRVTRSGRWTFMPNRLRTSAFGENAEEDASIHPRPRSLPTDIPQKEERETQDEYAARYYQYLQSQTNDQYRHYLKSPNFYVPPSDSRQQSTHALDPEKLLPVNVSTFLRYRLRLWRFLSDIGRSFELKFALKSAMVIAGIATLAFIPSTAQLFTEFRAHWCIISVAVVMTPTIGGSNIAGFYRVLGTFAGVGYSYFVLHFFGDRPFVTWAMLTLFSIPCFYGLLFSLYPRVGQVSLVSVASVTLSYFANPERWDLFELAWKQGVMVASGVVIGLLVTWYVWPYEARVELRKGLSDLLLNMGILYSRLVEVFNYVNPEQSLFSQHKHIKITPATLHNHYYLHFNEISTRDTLAYFLAFELKLHMDLLRLESLVPLTWLEPRLKGAFPVDIYRSMLMSCQNILDKFVAMRVAIGNNVTDDDPYLSAHVSPQLSPEPSTFAGSQNLILGISHAPSRVNSSINQEFEDTVKGLLPQHPSLIPARREMVGSVLLCFYIFAGALILKQPLPTYLPPIKQTRLRLMRRMRKIIKDLNKQQEKEMLASASSIESFVTKRPLAQIESSHKFINFYAYSLAMEDVMEELENLGLQMKSLFGEMFADVVQIHGHEAPDVLSPLERHDSSVSLYNDALEIEKEVEAKRLLSNSLTPIPIPLHHHHRADKWGDLRERVLDQIQRDKQQQRQSTIISPMSDGRVQIQASPFSDTLLAGGLLPEFGSPLVPSVIPMSTSANNRKSQQKAERQQANAELKDKAEWWRTSGNWMQ